MKELEIIFKLNNYPDKCEQDFNLNQYTDDIKRIYTLRIPFEIRYEEKKIKTLIESYTKKNNKSTESEKIVFVHNAFEYLKKHLSETELYDIFKINYIPESIQLNEDIVFDKSNQAIIYSIPVNDKLHDNLLQQMNVYLHIIEYFNKAKNFIWDSIVRENPSTLKYNCIPLRSCLNFINYCYDYSIDSYHLKNKIAEINLTLDKLYPKTNSNMQTAILFQDVKKTFSYLNEPEMFCKKPVIPEDLKKF